MEKINKSFETRYGLLNLVVHPLLGAPLYVTAEDILLPAGFRERSGRVLKRPIKISAGAILMPRQDKNYPEGRRWHLFPYGLHEALRACQHMRDHYESNEDGQVALLESQWRDLAFLARQLSRFYHLSAQARQELEEKIAQLSCLFERSQNLRQQVAGAQLRQAGTIHDSLGRFNPGATAARTMAASRQLSLRLEDIRQINPCLGRRQIALIQEKDRIRRTLVHFFKTRLEPLKEIADQCQKYLPSWEARHLFLMRLVASQAELASLAAAPYARWIKRVRGEVAELMRLLENNKPDNLPRFKVLVDRLYWALRFKQAREALEQILFTFPSHPSPEEVEGTRLAVLDFLDRFKELEEDSFRVKVKATVQQKVGTALVRLIKGDPRVAQKLIKEATRRL